MSDSLPPGTRSNFPHAVAMNDALRRQRVAAAIASMGEIEIHRNSALLDTPSIPILLQAVIIPGDKTAEGTLIESVALPWFEIIDFLTQSPDAIYAIHWRKWEEIIAAAYAREGYEVVLTPPSNDKGRDVIATKHGVGSVCFFDQVKAYSPGNLVTFEQVSSMLGVLCTRPNVSKGLITTTSSFAPGVFADAELSRFMPHRLELRGRDVLLPWLQALARR